MTAIDMLERLLAHTPKDYFYDEEEEEEEEGAGEDGGEDDGASEDGGEGEDGAGDDEGKDDEFNPDDFTPEGRRKPVEDGGEDDGDEDADDDDVKVIDQRINKRLAPVQAQIQAQNDELDANAYIQDNPEMLKYKPVILKYMAHPSYKDVPVSVIAAFVSSKDQQKIGASKERLAAKKAKESMSGGSSSRSGGEGGKKDYMSMPKAEFEAELLRIKSGTSK